MSTVKDLIEKIKNETVTLADQELALKHPETAYWFAKNVPGANIKKCQKAVCKSPLAAYHFVKHIPEANLTKIKKLCPEISDKIDEFIRYNNSDFYSELNDSIINKIATLADQDKALEIPELAYRFARDIPGANIEKCQEAACRDPEYAYRFAKNVKGADISICQEAVCKDPGWTMSFVCDVPGADVEKCIEVCKGTVWEDELNEYLMDQALE